MAARSKDTTVSNEDLEHTAGGATTRDGMDAGVPMTPGHRDEPIGPEDALGHGATRGDYRDRTDIGPRMQTRLIPMQERLDRASALAGPDGNAWAALGDVPTMELVPADADIDMIGDEPGKGGVSTALAVETATTDANTARVAAGVQRMPAREHAPAE
jgi:hypothetical protein